MRNSLVDKAILLPIEPWCRTKNIIANYNSKSFFHLISVDIYDIEIDDLISHLENLLKASSVIGIKLHPNLQNFFPIPSMNNYEIEKKLELIYHFASTNKLFILFHAGLSFFQKEVFSGAKVIARAHSKALLRNFINRDGRIEIIEKFDLKIIFAHLGHYGFGHVDTDLIRKISENYTNVYFDTSGQSPKSILKTLQSIGSRRIIFGSDSLYNKMAYNLVFAYKAINMVYNHCECREKAIMNIFQNNIIQLIRNK
jgi:predicted TIM-barrel fold metal-dependent hydrolase